MQEINLNVWVYNRISYNHHYVKWGRNKTNLSIWITGTFSALKLSENKLKNIQINVTIFTIYSKLNTKITCLKD